MDRNDQMKETVKPGGGNGGRETSDFLLGCRPKENTNYRIAKNKNIVWVGIIFNELIAWIVSIVFSPDALVNCLNKHWGN